MNQKGQMGVFVMLMTGIITLVVLSSLTAGFCEGCLSQTSFTQLNTLNDTWYNNTCVGEKCETDYSLTCNSTELEVATEYEIDSCNFMLTNASYNGTTCVLAYTAVTSDYNSDGILGTVVCFMPVLVGLGLVVLAFGVALI